MKYLSDYTKAGISQLMSHYGGFFAFSTSQFDEKKHEGVEYTDCGMGLFCPKENATKLVDGLIENSKKSIAQDLLENGKENIIRRELYNHEAFYIGCIDETVEKLEKYGITEEEIRMVYRIERHRQAT